MWMCCECIDTSKSSWNRKWLHLPSTINFPMVLCDHHRSHRSGGPRRKGSVSRDDISAEKQVLTGDGQWMFKDIWETEHCELWPWLFGLQNTSALGRIGVDINLAYKVTYLKITETDKSGCSQQKTRQQNTCHKLATSCMRTIVLMLKTCSSQVKFKSFICQVHRATQG